MRAPRRRPLGPPWRRVGALESAMRKWLLLIGAVLTLLSAGVLIIGAVSVPDLFEGPLLPLSPPFRRPHPRSRSWDGGPACCSRAIDHHRFSDRHCRYDLFTWGSDRQGVKPIS